ncbi:unnamed protein product [Cladocopium goreaui]|uniref:Fructose-1-phosphate phosphatase YqaB n=1 Tax=Cladocopium goreaui TaxID=2562237 RepID=A0A9P1DII0_9DINO|nr:unnamed protein product [Cladocopium goreaui]
MNHDESQPTPGLEDLLGHFYRAHGTVSNCAMDGDTRRWVGQTVEATAISGCNLLRSMLSDVGDMVCCLSGVGMAMPMSMAHVGSVAGLSRPPSRCEMLPGPPRRRKPFEELSDRLSLDGLLKESPLRLFRPGPSWNENVEPSPPSLDSEPPNLEAEIHSESMGTKDGLQSFSPVEASEGDIELVNDANLQEVYYLDDRIVEGPERPPGTAMSVWYLV